MANQKISELTAISTIDNATDVLPIVDTSETTTKKITLTQVKTSLALNNVDNTSDANKPISSATQTALDAKQATLVSGTNIKTVNSTSLLGSGDVAVQATLVSGTNIKTINSTSLLGSGDIAISASPSGVSGAIQFSNGSAFASDAANLFWDDTNKRLGVGTNSPTTPLQINGRSTFISLSGSALGTTTANAAAQFYINGQSSILAVSGYFNVGSEMQTYLSSGASVGGSMILQRQSGTINIGGASGSAKVNITGSGSTSSSTSLSVINSAGSAIFTIKDDLTIGIGLTNPTARTHIQGSGSTSATTSLLVQNSAGTELLKTTDDGNTTISNRLFLTSNSDQIYAQSSLPIAVRGFHGVQVIRVTGSTQTMFEVADLTVTTAGLLFNVKNNSFANMLSVNYLGQASMGTASPNASAQMQIDSTTRGFLPPRMTTTQKNAIASPAAGLVVYDSTTNKLCCYNGSTWNDLF